MKIQQLTFDKNPQETLQPLASDKAGKRASDVRLSCLVTILHWILQRTNAFN